MIMTSVSITVTSSTEIYTLSLHDALPIWKKPKLWRRPKPSAGPKTTSPRGRIAPRRRWAATGARQNRFLKLWRRPRSEEHTSELQSRGHFVCRLLPEKKKRFNHDFVIKD